MTLPDSVFAMLVAIAAFGAYWLLCTVRYDLARRRRDREFDTWLRVRIVEEPAPTRPSNVHPFPTERNRAS